MEDVVIITEGMFDAMVHGKAVNIGGVWVAIPDNSELKFINVIEQKLVKEYGMSSLGPISFGEKEELVFLGKEISEQRNYSEKVATQIDKEIAKFIKSAEKEARRILTKNRRLLDKIAKTLIEKETIERKEFEDLIGKKMRKVAPIKVKRKKLKVKVKRKSKKLKVKIKGA